MTFEREQKNYAVKYFKTNFPFIFKKKYIEIDLVRSSSQMLGLW